MIACSDYHLPQVIFYTVLKLNVHTYVSEKKDWFIS